MGRSPRLCINGIFCCAGVVMATMVTMVMAMTTTKVVVVMMARCSSRGRWWWRRWQQGQGYTTSMRTFVTRPRLAGADQQLQAHPRAGGRAHQQPGSAPPPGRLVFPMSLASCSLPREREEGRAGGRTGVREREKGREMEGAGGWGGANLRGRVGGARMRGCVRVACPRVDACIVSALLQLHQRGAHADPLLQVLSVASLARAHARVRALVFPRPAFAQHTQDTGCNCARVRIFEYSAATRAATPCCCCCFPYFKSCIALSFVVMTTQQQRLRNRS